MDSSLSNLAGQEKSLALGSLLQEYPSVIGPDLKIKVMFSVPAVPYTPTIIQPLSSQDPESPNEDGELNETV